MASAQLFSRVVDRIVTERLISAFHGVVGGRMRGVMYEGEVRAGETYRVRIPRREDPLRLLTGDPARAEVDVGLAQLARTRRTEFDLTVTETGRRLGAEPAVTGVRISETARICVLLPPETTAELGLTPGVDYMVDGILKDAATGSAVDLPVEHTITVPLRWLRPPR